MSIVNNYVSPNYTNSNGPKLDPAGLWGPGVDAQTAIAYFQPANGDNIGSIYRLFKQVPSDVIVTNLEILNDGWTTSCTGSFGLYQVLEWDGVGAVINSGAEFKSAYNLNTGAPASAGWVSILNALSIANRVVPIWQMAGQAEYPPKYAAFDIALTLAGATNTSTANTAVKLSYIRTN